MKAKISENINILYELPGDNGNAFSGSKRLYRKIKVNESKILAREAVDWEVDDNEKGGMIIFSRTVNAIGSSKNKLINWIKQKAKTLNNKVKSNKKIDDIGKKYELPGWTVGHFLDGRYTSKNGVSFGEDSLSVELIGVDTDKLLDIATELCRAFEQETVLVKCYNNGKIYFVNGN